MKALCTQCELSRDYDTYVPVMHLQHALVNPKDHMILPMKSFSQKVHFKMTIEQL